MVENKQTHNISKFRIDENKIVIIFVMREFRSIGPETSLQKRNKKEKKKKNEEIYLEITGVFQSSFFLERLLDKHCTTLLKINFI